MDALPPQNTLAALEAQVARDLGLLAYPAAPWVQPVMAPDGSEALDCAIIGAGQYGLCVAAGLRREQVQRIEVFDAAAAGQEGPWVTFARMAGLRTPKYLTGPDLGIGALSFQAYWEALHGAAGWDAIDRVPRTAWMDYLNWYRHVLDLPVRNGWTLVSVMPTSDARLMRLGFSTPDGPRQKFAKTVVLATGPMGGGGHGLPADLVAAVPPGRLHHANDVFDLDVLAGARVGIQGAGATAFDVGISALRAGAAGATVCVRRGALPRDNPRRWMETAGYLGHYVDLPDDAKWAIIRHLRTLGQPPPQPTYDTAMALPGFAIAEGFPWDKVTWTGDEIVVEGGGRRLAFDHLVVATGFFSDLDRRPEYHEIGRHAARWHDRYTPPEADAGMGRQPYLDRFGAFMPRDPAAAPWLDRVLTITGNASLSLGPITTSISGMKYAAPRLVEGVKRRIFLDQQAQDWDALLHRDHAELR
ncbi:FAD/NAD(P)-binding protein [Humitalea sp. 24SJ18S-53]|uniref:FAD/NAD(P)-binding protein n=1 Tax=Humitalea sp. 24SJ18S-53 TaxID=3422307 RepID=UPI003D668CC3